MTLHPDLKDEVGVRELHDKLSAYVRRAADGNPVVVTMRGKPVARLVPTTDHDPFAKLRARGLVSEPTGTWSPPDRAGRIKPTPGPPISDLVAEQRR
jgi:prevent-host-death family protein